MQELYGPEFLKGCHETAKRIERIAVDPQWTVDAMMYGIRAVATRSQEPS